MLGMFICGGLKGGLGMLGDILDFGPHRAGSEEQGISVAGEVSKGVRGRRKQVSEVEMGN